MDQGVGKGAVPIGLGDGSLGKGQGLGNGADGDGEVRNRTQGVVILVLAGQGSRVGNRLVLAGIRRCDGSSTYLCPQVISLCLLVEGHGSLGDRHGGLVRPIVPVLGGEAAGDIHDSGGNGHGKGLALQDIAAAVHHRKEPVCPHRELGVQGAGQVGAHQCAAVLRPQLVPLYGDTGLDLLGLEPHPQAEDHIAAAVHLPHVILGGDLFLIGVGTQLAIDGSPGHGYVRNRHIGQFFDGASAGEGGLLLYIPFRQPGVIRLPEGFSVSQEGLDVLKGNRAVILECVWVHFRNPKSLNAAAGEFDILDLAPQLEASNLTAGDGQLVFRATNVNSAILAAGNPGLSPEIHPAVASGQLRLSPCFNGYGACYFQLIVTAGGTFRREDELPAGSNGNGSSRELAVPAVSSVTEDLQGGAIRDDQIRFPSQGVSGHIYGNGAVDIHGYRLVRPFFQKPYHAGAFRCIGKSLGIITVIGDAAAEIRHGQQVAHLSAVAGVCCKICSFVFPDAGVIAHHHGDLFNHRIRVGVVLGVLTVQFRIVVILCQQASEGHAASYDLAKAAAGEGDGAALHGRQAIHLAAGDGQLSINAEGLPLGSESPALHSNLPVRLNLFHGQNAAYPGAVTQDQMTALNALDNKVPAVQVQGDASVAAVPAFAFLGKRAKNCGLGHIRISQSSGNRPVIMGGPVGVGASDIELFSAEGAFSPLVYLVMGTGVAAVAHAVLIKVFVGMLHHANRSIGFRHLDIIDIEQRVIILIGEGIARGQHTRQVVSA